VSTRQQRLVGPWEPLPGVPSYAAATPCRAPSQEEIHEDVIVRGDRSVAHGRCGRRSAAGGPGAAADVLWPADQPGAAKKVTAGAEAEARKNNWPVAIVILDSGGQMVMMQRLDNTQWGSVDIAKEKARTAVALRRPTKALQDGIAQGGASLRLLSTGFSMIEGGIPIVADGKVIGSIGVSGVTSAQDAQTAQAGQDALK